MRWRSLFADAGKALLLVPLQLLLFVATLVALLLLPLWTFALYGPAVLVDALPSALWLRAATLSLLRWERGLLAALREGWGQLSSLLTTAVWAWAVFGLMLCWGLALACLLLSFMRRCCSDPKEARCHHPSMQD